MTTQTGSFQWSPDQGGLNQLLHIFSGLLNPDLTIRTQANDALKQATSIPDFDNYLLHILLTDSGNSPMSTRSSAGLYLKNDLLRNWNSKQIDLKNHILTMLPHGLINKSHQIRKISSIIISSIFRKVGGPQNWPNLIPNLIQLLDGNAGIDGQKGAIDVLTLITEDSCRLLDRQYNLDVNNNNNSLRPLEEIIPRLINLLNTSSSNGIKSQCGKSLTNCINIGSMVVQLNLDKLLIVIFNQCQNMENDSKVNIQLASLFCSILDQWPQKLYDNLNGIILWIIHIISTASISDNDDDSEKLALQACEFLLGMVNIDTPKELILPIINQMLPLLLSKMVYSNDDVILMENDDARDQLLEDKDEDIKPQMAKSKEHTVSSTVKKSHDDDHQNNDNESDSDSDDDDDDDDDDVDEDNFTWNLRKCSAATVDVLSCLFPIETLNIAFPIIKSNINSNQWPIRESAILTLGAISEAALEHASSQLPELIQFLIERVKDDQPRVRQISCWTLGRYSSWVCSEAQLNGSFANYFEPTFEIILNCALDQNKVVQESACSAIADFIENTDSSILINLSETILNHFQIYFQRYRRKNLIVLYDTVQTFVEKVGDTLQFQPKLIDILLPPLISKWQSLEDHDKDLWPLLECMSSVAASLGEAFANYALPVYERAVRILQFCIEMDKMAKVQQGFDAPEKDFIVTSLDLIDGLIQGLSTNSIQLILHGDSQDKNYSLMELVITCLDDSSDDVRQSGYALLGDLAIHLIDPMIKPYIQTIMMCINNEINNPSDSSIAARNNAIWSLGEISIRITNEEFKQFFQPMVQGILTVVHNLNGDEDFTLIENAAITLGRFGINNGEELTQFIGIGNVINQWIEIMSKVMENEEKDSSFSGIINCISQKPELIISNVQTLQLVIKSIGEYNSPGDQLAGLFYQFLQNLKIQIGGEDSWNHLVLISGVQGELKTKYGL